MRLALRHRDRFLENYVFRRWVPMEVELEFRAFVVDGKLCALSQYTHLVHSPTITEKKVAMFGFLVAYLRKVGKTTFLSNRK